MAQRFLSNIKVNDAYTLPASDGTNGQAITTDGSGTLSFSDITVDEAPAVGLTVKNVSGGTLAIGTVVHPSPTASPPSGNVIEVIAADNSAASTMPAIGVLKAALADDAEGTAIAFGNVSGIDTSSFSAGDPIFVNSSGGFTATKPTGTALIQKIGIVVKSHASNGTIKVFGANRTNDVPNIAENYIWLGNSSGVATATEHLLNNVKDVTTSSPTDGQVLTWDNANSYWKNADASGGSGGTVTVEVNYSGDGTTQATDGTRVAFTVSSSIANEANTQVFIDGVYQAKDKYSVSGTTLTFESGNAPPSGTTLEIVHLKTVDADIVLNSHTANGTDTAFDAGGSIANENNTQVYIDGVYQNKGSYTVSGGNVDFGTGNAPGNGTIVEIVHIKPRPESTGGISWQSTAKTAAFTAVAGEGYFVDTSSSAITVTLPSSPSVGDEVALVDYAGNAGTNSITVTSSDDIMNSSDDKVINYNNGAVELVYSGSTKGWLVSAAANETAEALAAANVAVDYLVVAGGGSGGSRNGASGSGSGGGGAGGLLTSFGDNSGGGASSGDTLSLDTNTNYTVTVGTGGAGISSPANTYTAGNSGGNSVFSTITATGGGGGGSGNGTGAMAPKTGGSGGGSGYAGTGASATSSPVQGYAGGNPPSGSAASPYGAGGGGGAGSVGGDATSSAGGAGGSGLSVSITGSAVTYAAGGAGSIWTTGGSSNATANTGNGSGGAATSGSGNGGSGVVILRYPDSFTISETTSPAVLTFSTDSSSVAGYKITTFTAGSNGTIQFS